MQSKKEKHKSYINLKKTMLKDKHENVLKESRLEDLSRSISKISSRGDNLQENSSLKKLIRARSKKKGNIYIGDVKSV